MVAPSRSPKRLGELLIQRGIISPTQLELALQQQRSTKEFVGAILVRLGLVQPETLLATLSEQFGIPYEHVSLARVDWTVADQFPSSALSSASAFPIRADAESVTVAIANPLEVGALSDLGQTAKFRTINAVLVLEEELQMIRQAYHHQRLRRIAARLTDHGTDETH